MNPDETTADRLERIFTMQTDLNNYVFKKNHLTGANGEVLDMAAIFSAVNNDELKVNDLPNTWLANYAQAMQAEVVELQEELPWKWWSKDDIDIQNVRVELIDILHFLISAMISAGLTPEKVYDIYCQKHAVNINRQDAGYSKATKTEDDNKQIG